MAALNWRRWIPHVVLAISCCGLWRQTADANDTAARLQMTVRRMQDWLGSGPKADGWRRYLLLGILETQTAKGDDGDVGQLRRVLSQFNSGVSGITHPVFASVRRSIQDHIEYLSADADGDLQAVLQQAREEFRPIDAQMLERARKRVVGELRLLEAYYRQNLPRAQRQAIAQQLRLSELIALLSNSDFDQILQLPDDRQFATLSDLRNTLGEIRPQFSLAAAEQQNDYVPLAEYELEEFRQLVSATRLRFASNPALHLDAVYQRWLDALGEDLKKLNQAEARQASASIGRVLGLLQRADQAPALVAAVRKHHSRPNLHAVVSEDIANAFASQPVNDTRSVDETILGNRVLGTATTNGLVTIDFVDDQNLAHVSIHMLGELCSDGRVPKGPITAYSASTAQVEARRSILVNIGGLQEYAPYVAANLKSQFRGTSSIPLIDRLANRQYQQQKADAEAVAAYKTEQRLLTQFEQQTGERLDEGKQALTDFQEKGKELRLKLRNLRREFVVAGTEGENVPAAHKPAPTDVLDPVPLPQVFVRTSNTHLYAYGHVADSSQLAAPADPPNDLFPADLKVRVHESLISNLIAPFLSGRTLESYQFAAKAKTLLEEPPAALEQLGGSEDEQWAITFADDRPVQVEFDGNRITLKISGRQFSRQGQNYQEAIYITLRFRVQRIDGKLKLVREGKATAEFVVPGEKNAREIAFRTFLQDQLDASMQGDPIEDAVELPDNLIPVDQISGLEDPQRLENLELVQLRGEGGWLTVGWDYREVAPGQQRQPPTVVDTPAIFDQPLPDSQ